MGDSLPVATEPDTDADRLARIEARLDSLAPVIERVAELLDKFGPMLERYARAMSNPAMKLAEQLRGRK